MINFYILTSTPAELRNRLIARDVIYQDEEGNLVGIREGLEWVRLPDLEGWNVYMVKLVRAAEADEIEGEVQDDRVIWLRTKFGKWVRDNSVAHTHTLADGRQLRGRRIGTTFFLVREDDGANILGTWQ